LNPELIEATAHELAAEQIPWFVNGTLEKGAAAALAAHLSQCGQCRSDHEAHVRLYEAMQAEGSLVFAAEASFQKLMGRIDDVADDDALLNSSIPAAPTVMAPRRRRPPLGIVQWLAAAVLLEAAGLGYGAWAWHAHTASPGSYVTLSSAEPSYRHSARIRVVFRSGLSVAGLGTLLLQQGAHIIDGPTAANVYTLGFADAAITPEVAARRAAALRAHPDVLFAEPQDGAGNAAGAGGG